MSRVRGAPGHTGVGEGGGVGQIYGVAVKVAGTGLASGADSVTDGALAVGVGLTARLGAAVDDGDSEPHALNSSVSPTRSQKSRIKILATGNRLTIMTDYFV
jgi:hypothetical protein